MGRSDESQGPRHRADGPADARPAVPRAASARHASGEGAVEAGVFGHNTDVVPERRRIDRRAAERRPAETAAALEPEEERRAPGRGRRRAEQALDDGTRPEIDDAPGAEADVPSDA